MDISVFLIVVGGAFVIMIAIGIIGSALDGAKTEAARAKMSPKDREEFDRKKQAEKEELLV